MSIRERLCKLAVYLRSPALLAIWFVLINFSKVCRRQKNQKKIVVISHSIFEFDVAQLPSCPQVAFLPLRARVCKNVFARYIPKTAGLTDLTYPIQMHNYLGQCQKLYLFWFRFLLYLRWCRFIDGVFSANFVYRLQIELNRACIGHALPFIVLFKESLNPASQLEKRFGESYKHHTFLGSHMLVYGQNVKNFMLDVPGVDADKFAVVGCPRLDQHVMYAKKNQHSDEQGAVTLFWSSVSEKLLVFDHKDHDIISRATEKFHHMFLIAAILMPETTFNIKFKTDDHREELEALLKKNAIGLPVNVSLWSYGNPFELEVGSRALLGFNSTCLLEGIVLRVPVLEPNLPRSSIAAGGLLDDFPGSTTKPKELEDLLDVFRNPEGYVAAEEVREKVLLHYFGYKDGRSGERVINAILQAAS